MTVLVDQAQSLRQLAMQQLHRAPLIAITSGKGGVGKTNIAVNLAIRFSQLGRRVVLLDADLGTANADVLCNLSGSTGLAEVVAGRQSLRQAMIRAPGNFWLIPGASGLANMAALSEFQRGQLVDEMRLLEENVDLILVDTGAGVSPNVLSFLVGSDQQVVVTTAEPTALADAYAVIKSLSLQQQDLSVGLVVNMVHDPGEAKQVFNRLDAVCRRFLNVTVQYLGHVMNDPLVAAAVRNRRPFLLDRKRGSAAICVADLAMRLDVDRKQLQEQSWLRRMAKWWGRTLASEA